jgi:hypothetical protein
MSRSDADASGIDGARQLLTAARLWDQVDKIADGLTPAQRRAIAVRLQGKS